MNLTYLLNNTFSVDMAIDLGSEMTLIYIHGKGIVLKEPSYIACDKYNRTVQAVGSDAKEMLGKAPECIDVLQPIKSGVVSDYEMASKMLKSFISSVYDKTVLKPRVIVSVPVESTAVEQRAVYDVIKEAGARDVFLIDSPIAAASGAGCDISLARGMLIADIGGGRTNIASISVGASVIKKSIPVAGHAFDEEIIKYIKQTHNLTVGPLTAEKIKCEIGCVYPFDTAKTITVSGCDITSGLPRTLTLVSEEIKDVLIPCVQKIASLITSVLEETPTALQSDIAEDGILITGGGGKLYGIDKFLRMETGLKVFLTDNMDECVIRGAGEEIIKLYDSNSDSFCYTLYDI